MIKNKKAQIKSKKTKTFFRPRKSQKDFLDPEIQRISWPLQSFGSAKAQIKMQEMAFVLLALAILAIIALIFFIRFQSANIAKIGESAKQETAMSLLDKIASLQELRCSQGEICLDEDKVNIAKDKNLGNLFQGLAKVEVRGIYPTSSDIVIYQSGAVNQSYSTFVNLCEQKPGGWDCGIALLEVGIKA
jgi:type II secretory pathway pseudopilin PulG